MKIHRIINPVADENTYILEGETSLLIVDPGSDWDAIHATIDACHKPIAGICLTHAHYDHIMSLENIRDSYHYPTVYISSLEEDWLYTPSKNLSGLMRHDDLPNVICQPADAYWTNYHDYKLADFSFRIVPTPGHSIGSVSLIFQQERLAFTGDALFKDSIGRWDLPTGNKDTLLTSIHRELLTLPDDFTIYPGHRESSTIARERDKNPFLQ